MYLYTVFRHVNNEPVSNFLSETMVSLKDLTDSLFNKLSLKEREQILLNRPTPDLQLSTSSRLEFALFPPFITSSHAHSHTPTPGSSRPPESLSRIALLFGLFVENWQWESQAIQFYLFYTFLTFFFLHLLHPSVMFTTSVMSLTWQTWRTGDGQNRRVRHEVRDGFDSGRGWCGGHEK